MWNHKITLFVVLLPVLLLGGCQKTNLRIKSDQIIFFEFERHNYAWVFQHNGWMIDNSGKIFGYNLPDAWTLPDSAGYISETGLEMNLSQTDTLFNYQIGTSELSQKIKLIPWAAKGKLSERKQVMSDAGVGGFYCYVWDGSKNKYKKVLLEIKGDWEQTNLSYEAHTLVTWLKQCAEKL